MTTEHWRVPDQLELLEFFGVEPSESDAIDGYRRYDLSDKHGVRLQFSFHVGERSVQTTVSVAGRAVVSVSHELATAIVMRNGRLECEFMSDNSKTTLIVALGEHISVEWSTLRTR